MAHMPHYLLPRAASPAALASCSLSQLYLSLHLSKQKIIKPSVSDLLQIFKFSYVDIYRYISKVLLLQSKVRDYVAR